jgi:glycosyltransferase involved in cell wall biosynthesis
MNIRKLKIGIGHPRLGRGGSEARAMWAIEALKADFNVSLITGGAVDLDGLNQFYSTQVNKEKIAIRKAPISGFSQRLKGGDALLGKMYQRFCRKIAHEFDVLISTYNQCDFGKPAIQCIADFSWDEDIRRSFDPPPQGARGLFHRNKLLRKCYLGLTRFVAQPSGRNLFSGEDLILANSRWSAQIIKEKYGKDIGVLYPPVFDKFPNVPFETKEMGFVCIGRISPEKRIERIVEILKGVRERGHDIHFHVIGGTDGSTYGKFVEDLCRSQGDWITMEGRQFGAEKAMLLSQHRFGIQARQREPFGISVAEMVKAGCITFVPSEGGQAEIVGHKSLMYDSVEDAVNKIDTVLRKPQLQAKFREHLENQGTKFSTDALMDGLWAGN